jgi:hypothetical protein
MSADEQTRALEAMLSAEEKNNDLLVKDLAALREALFKHTQRASELKKSTQAVDVQIQGLYSSPTFESLNLSLCISLHL